MSDPNSSLTPLHQRSSYEEADAAYRKLFEQLTDVLVTSHGVRPTGWKLETGNAGCSDFPNVGGRTTYYSMRGETGPITDAQWPAAVENLRAIARPAGFSDIATVVDKPGNHEVAFGNPQDHARIVFGTAVNTILSIEGSCHLPAAVKKTVT